ncbi:hypothetical protein ACFC01_13025 [Streptomyces mirabilis]|uniref:hypothetical protein n=1 Tax=Streptomyces mirabilis TaxID=68239 RepID=UPI0035D9E7B8
MPPRRATGPPYEGVEPSVRDCTQLALAATGVGRPPHRGETEVRTALGASGHARTPAEGPPTPLLTQTGALVHGMKFGPDRPGPPTAFVGRSFSRPRIRLDLTGMTAEDWAPAEASSTPMPGPIADP